MHYISIFYCAAENSFLTMCVFPSGNDLQQRVGSIIKRCGADLHQCIDLLLIKKNNKFEYTTKKGESVVSIAVI